MLVSAAAAAATYPFDTVNQCVQQTAGIGYCVQQASSLQQLTSQRTTRHTIRQTPGGMHTHADSSNLMLSGRQQLQLAAAIRCLLPAGLEHMPPLMPSLVSTAVQQCRLTWPLHDTWRRGVTLTTSVTCTHPHLLLLLTLARDGQAHQQGQGPAPASAPPGAAAADGGVHGASSSAAVPGSCFSTTCCCCLW